MKANIKANKHLPRIPSAKEMVDQSNDMLKNDARHHEKIEELTLYLIASKREVSTLRTENEPIKHTLRGLSLSN